MLGMRAAMQLDAALMDDDKTVLMDDDETVLIHAAVKIKMVAQARANNR